MRLANSSGQINSVCGDENACKEYCTRKKIFIDCCDTKSGYVLCQS